MGTKDWCLVSSKSNNGKAMFYSEWNEETQKLMMIDHHHLCQEEWETQKELLCK